MIDRNWKEPKKCHDCAVAVGEFHKLGCDVERCPFCGGQLLSCGCFYEKVDIVDDENITDEEWEKWEQLLKDSNRKPWNGIWPGVEACNEYGLWCKWSKDTGWVKCDREDPNASEDLNRLMIEFKWDCELQKRVPR